jgi:hypothetical protein
MKQRVKHGQEHEQQHEAGHETKSAGQEFTSADELLRHDARQTIVPPGITARLKISAGQVPPPTRSWWKTLLGW